MGKTNENEMEQNVKSFCQQHQGSRGVAVCPVCGNSLCKECLELDEAMDASKKKEGEVGAIGCCLCGGSAKIASLETGVEKMKKRAKRRFAVGVVAAIFGALMGLSSAIVADGDIMYKLLTAIISCPIIAYCMVGFSYLMGDVMRCFLDWIKGFIKTLASIWTFNFWGLFIALIIAGIVPIFRMYAIIFKSLIIALPETLAMKKFLAEADGELAKCKNAAETYIDYAKYVDVVGGDETKDIKTLMGSNGALYNNAYAQMVVEQGKDYAENSMVSVKKIVRVNCKELKDKIINRRYGKASFLSMLK